MFDAFYFFWCIFIFWCLRPIARLFWHPILHSNLHVFSHSIWHSFWHSFWHSMWQIFWHSFWHVFGPVCVFVCPDWAGARHKMEEDEEEEEAVKEWGQELHLFSNLETLTWLGINAFFNVTSSNDTKINDATFEKGQEGTVICKASSLDLDDGWYSSVWIIPPFMQLFSVFLHRNFDFEDFPARHLVSSGVILLSERVAQRISLYPSSAFLLAPFTILLAKPIVSTFWNALQSLSSSGCYASVGAYFLVHQHFQHLFGSCNSIKSPPNDVEQRIGSWNPCQIYSNIVLTCNHHLRYIVYDGKYLNASVKPSNKKI